MIKRNQNRPTNRYDLRAGALTLAAVAMLLPACADGVQEAVEPDTAESPTAEQVAEAPQDLYGQTVTIRGEVEQMIDAISFTITTDEPVFEGEEILIVNTMDEGFELPEEGTPVQVTGEVRQFKAFDFERDFDLTPLVEAEDYEERPTIAAESIVLAPEPEEITENPATYYDQTIATQGEVEEVISPSLFTFDGGELLVLSLTDPGQVLDNNEEVVVTGEVRQFVLTDIERDYDLTLGNDDADLREQLEVEYQNATVFIAENIYPVEPQ